MRAHAWVAGQIPGWGICERQRIDVSLPLFLPPFSSKNKMLKKKTTSIYFWYDYFAITLGNSIDRVYSDFGNSVLGG